MFAVTALGHQGWLVGSATTRVLIDPILAPRFSRMVTSRATVYPPRSLDLSGFPPIDAVLVSHEHPDHLDFASLQRLDPRTPVLLSAHASDAARRVIASIGLDVHPLDPGVAVSIGDLSVMPFAPPRVGEAGSNELDVVPMLVRDRAGHGSFFTAVDLPAGSEWAAEVRSHLDRPGVWAQSNSGFDRSLHFGWISRVADPVADAARQMAERYVSLFDGWGHPEIVMVTDNGLTLGGDLEALNAHVFEVDNEALCEALRRALPSHVFHAALPGTTAELVDGALVAVRPTQPFVAPAERDRWPAHGGAQLSSARLDFQPGTGRRSLGPGDQERLEEALDAFGRFLFGRGTFCGLYQLAALRDHPPALRPTVALVLREGDDGGAQVWEYRAQGARFVRVACEHPTSDYVAGAVFWATDLLAVLTFETPADDLFHFGRKWLWNASPAAFRCDLDTEVELFAHALRAPDAVERLYLRSLETGVRPALRFGGAAVGAEWPACPERDPVFREVPAALARATPTAATGAPGAVATRARPGEHAHLAAAVEKGTAGAWSLAAVQRCAAGELRLTLSIAGADAMTLEIAPASATARYYRRIGDLSFSYSPSGVAAERLLVLDQVIVAVATQLSAVQMPPGPGAASG